MASMANENNGINGVNGSNNGNGVAAYQSAGNGVNEKRSISKMAAMSANQWRNNVIEENNGNGLMA
jgi:hypothetical protein